MQQGTALPARRRRLTSVQRIGAAVVSALAFVVVIVAPQTSAQAYNTFGCRWASAAVTYYVPSPYISFPWWLNAGSSWSGLDASLTWANIASPNFYGLNESRGNTVSWTGVTRKKGTVQDFPPCVGGLWTSGQMEVVINTTYPGVSGYTTNQKQGICAHEMGHALGLAHNASTSGGVPVALMYPYDDLRNANNIYQPKTDDRNGVNAIY